MIDMMKSPPKGFEEVVIHHFRLKASEITRQVGAWSSCASIRAELAEKLTRANYCSGSTGTAHRLSEKLLKICLPKAFKTASACFALQLSLELLVLPILTVIIILRLNVF